jgi:Tfp pilus assembly protein PilV
MINKLLAARRDARPCDDGFMLLEAIISISLIVIIMSALTTFFVTASRSTSELRGRQTASQLAASAVDRIRVMQPSDTYAGRSTTAVTTQFQTAPADVAGWLAAMTKVSDDSGATPTLPMVETATVNGLTFSLTNYIGSCTVATVSGPGDQCATPSTDPSLSVSKFLRMVMSVSWTDNRCAASTCRFITATLLSSDSDPDFLLNEAPPAVPVITDPGTQSSAINDVASLQLALDDGTGVSPITWSIPSSGSGSLPAGLSMDPTGLITGTITGPTNGSGQSVVVSSTDAFLRTVTMTFSWIVLSDLVPSNPGPQSAYFGVALSNLTLTATGGSGAPFTWSAPAQGQPGSLPPGLTLADSGDTGVISGTPTAVGNYSSVVTVADSSGRTRTRTIAWTVVYPPLTATATANQTSTVNTAITPLALDANGGSGNYVWSDPSRTLPTGLSVSAAGVVSGTPTSTVSGRQVRLSITDSTASMSTTQIFNWTVVLAPTVTAPSNQVNTVGGDVSLQLSISCSNTPCTMKLSNGPPGLAISAAGLITGTVGTVASYPSVLATITDAAGKAVTSAAFTWTVKPPPSISGITALTAPAGSPVTSQALSYTCPTSSCSFSVAGMPSGVGLSLTTSGGTVAASVSVSSSSGTIYLRGTVATTAGGSFTVAVTPTDSIDSISGTPISAAWIVTRPTASGLPSPYTLLRGWTVSSPVDYTCPTATCTLTLSGAPAGLGLSATATGAVSASINVTAASGVVYLRGTISATATQTSYAVKVAIVDTKYTVTGTTATASWTVATSAAALANLTASRGAAITTQSLSYNCTSTCTMSFASTRSPSGSLPGNWLSTTSTGTPAATISEAPGGGTFYVAGTVSSTASTGTYSVSVTVNDPNGITITEPATWTIQ